MSYWKDKKLLVTGGHGFVGTTVMQELQRLDVRSLSAPRKKEYDLRQQGAVKALFAETKPDIVLHLAGKVGGIVANKKSPADFFYDNIMMGTLVMDAAFHSGVKRMVALAAGCGYPIAIDVPYTEDDFWKGLPDDNSLPYAMAKKMLIVQSWSYRAQYGFNSSILLPSNLYGPYDNFHLENSHVVPALVRKFVEATIGNDSSVCVWGSGKASREFLFVRDAAKAIIEIAEKYNESGPLNLGTGKETPIIELVETLQEVTGYQGEVVWDRSRPDGQARRKFDMTRFEQSLEYRPCTSLREGLEDTVAWYKENRDVILKADQVTEDN